MRRLAKAAEFGTEPAGRVHEAGELLLTRPVGDGILVRRVHGNIIGNSGTGPVAASIRALCWEEREVGWLGTSVIYDR